MHGSLEIEVERVSVGTNNHIRAYTARPRNVSIGIVQADISGIVRQRNANLLTRGQDQARFPGDQSLAKHAWYEGEGHQAGECGASCDHAYR